MSNKYELLIIKKVEFETSTLGKVEGSNLHELLGKFSMIIYEILQQEFALEIDKIKTEITTSRDDDIPF